MDSHDSTDFAVAQLCDVMDAISEGTSKDFIILDDCSSPEPSEAEIRAQKRVSQGDVKEPPSKISKISDEKLMSTKNAVDKKPDQDYKESKGDLEIDIWDEYPEQLYGLKQEFLDSIGVRPPLTSWVHISNVKCERNLLKELLEVAGTVLHCNVVHTVKGYARVQFSHPLEAVQAISLLDKQIFYGRVLSVALLRVPPEESLPKGLQKLGKGFGSKGKPLRDITRHLERYLKGKPSQIETSILQNGKEEPYVEGKVESSQAEENENQVEPTDPAKETATKEEQPKKVTRNRYVQTDKEKPVVDERIVKKIEKLKEKGVTVATILTTLDSLTKTESKPDRKRDSSITDKPTKSNSDGDPYSNYSAKKGDRPPPRISVRQFGRKSSPVGRELPKKPILDSPGNFNNQGGNSNQMYGSNPNFNVPNNNPGALVGAFSQPGSFQGVSPSGSMSNLNPNLMAAVQMAQNLPFGQMQNMGNMAAALGMNAPNVNQNQNNGNPIMVVLSNLPASISFQLLREKMCQCGEVKFIKTTTPGCAIVGYATRWEAERCINTFNNTVVDNHKVEVKFM